MPKNIFFYDLSKLLSSHVILHKSTSLQQNGIAEKKNRHLVEIVRTLLLGANMLIHYWGDTILTICFII